MTQTTHRGHRYEVRKVIAMEATVTDYVRFTENNEWEGETWHFYIPTRGNEEALKELKYLLDEVGSETYEVDLTTIPELEVDILVKHTEFGYLAYQNKLVGRLALTPEVMKNLREGGDDGPFYKGKIKDYMRDATVGK
jgi:hypothetical protein